MKSEPPPDIVLTPEPDALEKKIRIGCGAIFGILVGLAIGLVFWPTVMGIGIAVAFGVVGCAWMALKLGDKFWKDKAAHWLTWW